MEEHCTVTTDWAVKNYAGIDLHWNHQQNTCRLSIKGYTQSVLKKNYDQPLPSKPKHYPHRHFEITCGAKQQLVPDNHTSPALDITGIRRIQAIVGALLYYSRAVDNKLSVALSDIGTQ